MISLNYIPDTDAISRIYRISPYFYLKGAYIDINKIENILKLILNNFFSV